MEHLLNESDSANLKHQLAFESDKEHMSRMDLLIEQQEYNLFQMLKPKLYKDGNQWCCLYGENIMEGIVGFGDTPYKAVLKWSSAWNEEIPKPSKIKEE